MRARESLEKHGGVDTKAFGRLSGLLRYVSGDYGDPATFQPLRKALGSAQRPAYYLAIPPTVFEPVVEHLETSGCNRGARVIVEKPFGRDVEEAWRIVVPVLKAAPLGGWLDPVTAG